MTSGTNSAINFDEDSIMSSVDNSTIKQASLNNLPEQIEWFKNQLQTDPTMRTNVMNYQEDTIETNIELAIITRNSKSGHRVFLFTLVFNRSDSMSVDVYIDPSTAM